MCKFDDVSAAVADASVAVRLLDRHWPLAPQRRHPVAGGSQQRPHLDALARLAFFAVALPMGDTMSPDDVAFCCLLVSLIFFSCCSLFPVYCPVALTTTAQRRQIALIKSLLSMYIFSVCLYCFFCIPFTICTSLGFARAAIHTFTFYVKCLSMHVRNKSPFTSLEHWLDG